MAKDVKGSDSSKKYVNDSDGSGGVVCSLSHLIRWTQRARCQAETPLIALCRFPEPALYKRTLTIRYSLISIYEYVVASTLERDIQVTAPFFVARITK
jgi:hypothetical protein